MRSPSSTADIVRKSRYMNAGELIRHDLPNRSCEKFAGLWVRCLWTFTATVFAVSQPAVGQDERGPNAFPANHGIPGPSSPPTAPPDKIATAINPLPGSTAQTTKHSSNETLGQFLSSTTIDGNPRIPQAPKPTTTKSLEFLPTADFPTNETQQLEIEPTQIELVPAKSLSLTDLETLAFEHNPTLSAAKARLSAARGQQLQAGLYPNPKVGYLGMQMGINGTAGQQGGFIGQRIITGGKLKLDQAAAGKQVTATHFEFRAQELRVLSDVRIRFYEAMTVQQRVKLTKELVRIGDELVRATEQLLTGRQATVNDLLLAEIQVDESRILLDNATNEELQAWRRLAAIIGMPGMQPTALSGQIEQDARELDWATCYATVMNNNPVLNAARSRVDRARILLQRARKEPVPDLDLLVTHGHHNVTNDNVTTVQAGFPLPIFNRNQGNIRSAESQLQVASKNRERIELSLQDQLAVAFRRYANAQQQIARYGERMIPKAEKSLKLVTEGYEKGQVQYLTLLTAQRTYWQVNLSYLDSLRELRTASSLIEGQLLSNSLSVGN